MYVQAYGENTNANGMYLMTRNLGHRVACVSDSL